MMRLEEAQHIAAVEHVRAIELLPRLALIDVPAVDPGVEASKVQPPSKRIGSAGKAARSFARTSALVCCMI